MMSVSVRVSRTALFSCMLLWGASTVAQANPAWVDPLGDLPDIAAAEPGASTGSADQGASVSDQVTPEAQAARALAVDYLNLWSAPNRLTLAAASSFYGPTVMFHGHERTLGSVLAEKRRFTERWPQRSYQYGPRPRWWRARATDPVARSGPSSTFLRPVTIRIDTPVASENTSLL